MFFSGKKSFKKPVYLVVHFLSLYKDILNKNLTFFTGAAAELLWRHTSNPIRSNFQLFFWQSDLFEFFAPGRTRTRDHFSPGWSKTLNGTKNFGTTRSNARNHNTILCYTHIDFRRRGSSGRLFGWWLYVLCCKNSLVYPPSTVD